MNIVRAFFNKILKKGRGDLPPPPLVTRWGRVLGNEQRRTRREGAGSKLGNLGGTYFLNVP